MGFAFWRKILSWALLETSSHNLFLLLIHLELAILDPQQVLRDESYEGRMWRKPSKGTFWVELFRLMYNMRGRVCLPEKRKENRLFCGFIYIALASLTEFNEI